MALVPPSLYFAAEFQSGVVEALLVAAFYFSISMLFFSANFFSGRIALFALLRWMFESFSTFWPSYRLRFYGFLALGGCVSYLIKAIRLAQAV